MRSGGRYLIANALESLQNQPSGDVTAGIVDQDWCVAERGGLIKMAQVSKANRRGSAGPRIAPVALFASCAACVTLAIVWQHAQNYDPTRLAQGATLAQQALQSHGLNWARVTERDGLVNIAGAAPSEAARVIAYHATRRALRPLMGRDATVTGIRSLVVLKAKAEPLGRAAVSPPLDVASLPPPPMPLVHEAVRHAALEPDSAPAAAASPAPSSNAGIETGAVTRTEVETIADTVASEASEARSDTAPLVAEAMPDTANPTPQAAAADVTPELAPTETMAPVEQDVAVPETSGERAHEAAEVEPAAAPEAPTQIAATEIESGAAQAAAEPEAAPPADACADAFADALDGTTINFARASAAIQKESRPLLDKLASIAKRCKGYRLTVEGHTDLTGSPAANLTLSKKRAEAVRWALIDRGIDIDHIGAEGFGASRPLEDATSEEANAKNRRIAITVSDAPRNAKRAAR